jgi:hypothetical protein
MYVSRVIRDLGREARSHDFDPRVSQGVFSPVDVEVVGYIWQPQRS